MAELEGKWADHHSLIFACDCADSHYLRVEWDDEDPEWRYFWVEGFVRQHSLKQRIKWAVDSLRGKIVYNDGVILNDITLASLKEFINKH